MSTRVVVKFVATVVIVQIRDVWLPPVVWVIYRSVVWGEVVLYTTPCRASLTVYGNNTYVLEPFTQRLGFIGERLSGNSLKSTLNESTDIPQTSTSLAAIPSGLLEQTPHPTGRCPEALTTMMYFKKLKTEYKKGIVKVNIYLYVKYVIL